MRRSVPRRRSPLPHGRSVASDPAVSPLGRTPSGATSLRVLVMGPLESSREFGELASRVGWTVTRRVDPESVRPTDGPFDLVFIDRRWEGESLSDVVHLVQERWPGARVVRLAPNVARSPSHLLSSHAPSIIRSARGGEGAAGRRTPVPSATPSPKDALPLDLGIGRLEPGEPPPRAFEEPEQRVLQIDATGAPPRLLGRLLVGGYITGQDRVIVTASDDLTALQREEIRQTAHRVLGMSVVADREGRMEVQSFLDPAKYGFVPLLNRTVWMLRAQLELCRRALDGTDQDFLPDVEEVEEGVDRLYLLMVRQLLLSSDSPSIARRIEVESRHYQIGDRLVAKMLEVIGDLIHEVGKELAAHREGFQTLSPEIARDLVGLFQRFDSLLKRTAESFVEASPFGANGLLDEIQSSIGQDSSLGDELARRIPDPKLAMSAERVVWSLVLAFDMLVVVNEVTINRSVEPVSGGGSGATLRFPESTGPGR